MSIRPQPLPACHRYPHLPCSGDCQYILPAEACAQEHKPGKVCHSCGATSAEAPFPPRWAKGQRRWCLECEENRTRQDRVQRPGGIITRAGFRQWLRHRAVISPQLDLFIRP